LNGRKASNTRPRAAPPSPRSVCIFVNRQGQFGASWANPAGNLPHEHLTEAAAATLGQCGRGVGVSGLARNTLLENKCTAQCISNQPTGCR
jgi:hypothetical protein